MLSPTEILSAILNKPTAIDQIRSHVVTSPFTVIAKCQEGRCHYLQFMEDSFATGASFPSGGAWTFRSNPNGEQIEI
jgi:hypothetical protein